MSKQLSVSAAMSIFVMAAFALFSQALSSYGQAHTKTGASAFADTPVFEGSLISHPFIDN